MKIIRLGPVGEEEEAVGRESRVVVAREGEAMRSSTAGGAMTRGEGEGEGGTEDKERGGGVATAARAEDDVMRDDC